MMKNETRTLDAFDAGYTQALMSLDLFIRTRAMNAHPAIKAIRTEIIAMLNDMNGILKEDVEVVRDDYR
jgi:hypothetical protein